MCSLVLSRRVPESENVLNCLEGPRRNEPARLSCQIDFTLPTYETPPEKKGQKSSRKKKEAGGSGGGGSTPDGVAGTASRSTGAPVQAANCSSSPCAPENEQVLQRRALGGIN